MSVTKLTSATTRGIVSALAPFGTLIYGEMSRLAREHGAVDLAQGFPFPDGPAEVREFAAKSFMEGPHQYQSSLGIIELRTAIAAKTKHFNNIEVNPETEVIVTMGAQEALAAALLSLVEPGEEVIVFDPLYASYLPMLAMAHVVPRRVSLRGRDFAIDFDELAAVFNDKTRAIIINSPMNPAGRVFTPSEYEAIAALCEKHDAILIGDEVYEHYVYDGRKNETVLSYAPGRSLAISSFSKTFAYTGWRVGWAQGPREFIHAINMAHQSMSYCLSAALQKAATFALSLPDSYYSELLSCYQGRRDVLCGGLADIGLEPIVPAGGLFACFDARNLGFKDDIEACYALPEQAGVAGAPVSVFWESEEHKLPLVRLNFAKDESILQDAIKRLGAFKSRRG